MPTVSKLAIAPVKGLALSHPPSVELGPHGVEGNRLFYLVGPDGRHRSGLAFGPLARIRQDYDAAAERLTLHFPDGSVVAGAASADGAPVEIPWGSRYLHGRTVDGRFAAALSDYVGLAIRLVRAEPGQHPQSAPASLLSQASLDELERSADGPDRLDDRRFRMLVTIDGVQPFEEDGWLGQEVGLGEAVVRVEVATTRCATTTRDPTTGLRDWDALRALLDLRGLSPSHTIDFGVYGSVVRPGRIALGDEVRPPA